MKKIVLLTLIVPLVTLGLVIPNTSSAQSPNAYTNANPNASFGNSANDVEKIKKQIDEMNALILKLKGQVEQRGIQTLPRTGGNDTTPHSSDFCYDFNRNLSSNGALNSDDIVALNKVLASEGLAQLDYRPVFNENAVKNFQRKYEAEVLKPVGLTSDTASGFVGAATRSKLNRLYGCNKKIQISIDPIVNNLPLTITSPQNGQVLSLGDDLIVKWLGSYEDEQVLLGVTSSEGGTSFPGEGITVDDHAYVWQNPGFMNVEGVYVVRLYKSVSPPNIPVISNAVKFIVSDIDDGDIQKSVSVAYPNGGEKIAIGSRQNISWRSQPNLHTVDIYMGSIGGNEPNTEYLIIKGLIKANTFEWEAGKYVGKPDQFVEPGNYYLKICVSGTNDCDRSNGLFQLYSDGRNPVSPTRPIVNRADIVSSATLQSPGDGKVDGADLAAVLGAWGVCPISSDCVEDINGDKKVDGSDVDLVIKNWTH